MIENRRNGANLERFTDQQRMFVLYLLADEEYCPTLAARKAGAKNPKLQANRWLKMPHVAAFLGKAKREREERTQISSDEVWRYLRLALYFNPFKLWKACPEGGWIVEDKDDIPDEIGALIKDVEEQTVVTPDGQSHTRFRVKLIDKDKVLAIAAKHAIPQEMNVNVGATVIDWDTLLSRDEDAVDPIEARIEQEGRDIPRPRT